MIEPLKSQFVYFKSLAKSDVKQAEETKKKKDVEDKKESNIVIELTDDEDKKESPTLKLTTEKNVGTKLNIKA